LNKTIENVEQWFAKDIEEVARQAGLKVQVVNPVQITCGIGFQNDRSQTVWIRVLGTDAEQNVLCRFSSPALEMEADQLLGQQAANDLLRENLQLAHGSWGVEVVGDKSYLVVYRTQIATAMQPEEFKSAILGLASTADAMEQKLGKDAY
jgi:nitrogen fixation protein FixH